jgi:hypothetical protein
LGTRRYALAALLVAVAIVATTSGCDLPPAQPPPRLWTMFDLEPLYDQLGSSGAIADGYGVPGGLPLSSILASGSSNPQLAIGNTFTLGYRDAYVTTEVWAGFPQVWAQPMYIAVVTWAADGTVTYPGGATKPTFIFSVGPHSAFYSPYWRGIYFEVPADTAPDAFTSSRQVLDAQLPMHEGPGWVAPLVPGPVAVLPDPIDPARLSQPKTVQGWLDGQPISALNFGTGTFQWDASFVVAETPLFVMMMRDASGDPVPLGSPSVGGEGPLFSATPAQIAGPGQPRYGSYWRLYTALAPQSARVFAPPQSPLNAVVAGKGVPVVADDGYGADVLAAPLADIAGFVGRIALNPACFASLSQLDPQSGAGSCVWLDSQGAIETNIGGPGIDRTDLLVTCPFVNYQETPVKLP